MVMGGDLNALNTFPITWWIGHQDEVSEPDKHFDGHYPYARRLRTGWRQPGPRRRSASAAPMHPSTRPNM